MTDNVTDYMREYRTDAEYVVTLPPGVFPNDPEIKIEISAVGGGEVGEAYPYNNWIYNVYADGDLVISGADLRSGAVAATHAEMVVTLANFLSADAEVIAFGGEDAEHVAGQLTESGRAFLEAEGERLGDWGHDSRHDI